MFPVGPTVRIMAVHTRATLLFELAGSSATIQVSRFAPEMNFEEVMPRTETTTRPLLEGAQLLVLGGATRQVPQRSRALTVVRARARVLALTAGDSMVDTLRHLLPVAELLHLPLAETCGCEQEPPLAEATIPEPRLPRRRATICTFLISCGTQTKTALPPGSLETFLCRTLHPPKAP